jgi:protein AbiQ
MRWINLNDLYLDYLRNEEKRIPRTDYGTNKYKPFFGVLFEVNDLYYVTQVSHPQPRHNKLKQQKDFYKIFDPKNPNRLIAVINLNYMFPIPKSETSFFEKSKIDTYRTFSSPAEKSKYIDLLDTELYVINSMDIGAKAKALYDLKNNNPEHIVSKRCIDFKNMEKLALKYVEKKIQTKVFLI